MPKDEVDIYKIMRETASPDDGDGEFENILTRRQKGDVSRKTNPLKKSSYVIPYSKPLMSEAERKSLVNEIDEIRFKVMTNPEPDPDLGKGIGPLLDRKKIK